MHRMPYIVQIGAWGALQRSPFLEKLERGVVSPNFLYRVVKPLTESGQYLTSYAYRYLFSSIF